MGDAGCYGTSRERCIRTEILNDNRVQSMGHLPREQGGDSLNIGLTYASAIRVPQDAQESSNPQQDPSSVKTKYPVIHDTSRRTVADLNRFEASPFRVSSLRLIISNVGMIVHLTDRYTS